MDESKSIIFMAEVDASATKTLLRTKPVPRVPHSLRNQWRHGALEHGANLKSLLWSSFIDAVVHRSATYGVYASHTHYSSTHDPLRPTTTATTTTKTESMATGRVRNGCRSLPSIRPHTKNVFSVSPKKHIHTLAGTVRTHTHTRWMTFFSQ